MPAVSHRSHFTRSWQPLFYLLFAMLTLDSRGRIIFSLCIDPRTRARKSSRQKFGRNRTSLSCSDSLIPSNWNPIMLSRLIDWFHRWAILPKMVTIKGYIEVAPNQLESKVFHSIDQRDIKPDNLLVDQDIYLKIIIINILYSHCNIDDWYRDASRGWGWGGRWPMRNRSEKKYFQPMDSVICRCHGTRIQIVIMYHG